MHTYTTECFVKGCGRCDGDQMKCDECEKDGRFEETRAECVTGGGGGGGGDKGGLPGGAIAGEC